MPQEIERKFLVKGDYKQHAASSSRILQGYICRSKERSVRVRLCGQKGCITIKGATTGFSRYEWEKEIPPREAEELMKLCLPGIIDKTRTLVPYNGHTWEIDSFHGAHEGLVLAEIELQSEEEPFDLPPFIGREVTGDPRYYNTYLAEHPAPPEE